MKLMRRNARLDRNTGLVALYACVCEHPRGPIGGVCGLCANAIPTHEEYRALIDDFQKTGIRPPPGADGGKA